MTEAERLARQFHEAYERLSPAFGYVTKPETRVFDPKSDNGMLMISVCQEVLSSELAARGERNAALGMLSISLEEWQKSQTELRRLAAQVEALRVSVLPAGWVAVPVEPTETMLDAAMDRQGSRVEAFGALCESGVPIECGMSEDDAKALNAEILAGIAKDYTAMLAARPGALGEGG